MATEKKNGTLAAGATENLTITNFARFSILWRGGPLDVAMIQPSSGDPVPVLNGAESYGSFIGDMIGVTLRLVNKGAEAVNVTVYEE